LFFDVPLPGANPGQGPNFLVERVGRQSFRTPDRRSAILIACPGGCETQSTQINTLRLVTHQTYREQAQVAISREVSAWWRRAHSGLADVLAWASRVVPMG
jgi:hypothetical protein